MEHIDEHEVWLSVDRTYMAEFARKALAKLPDAAGERLYWPGRFVNDMEDTVFQLPMDVIRKLAAEDVQEAR